VGQWPGTALQRRDGLSLAYLLPSMPSGRCIQFIYERALCKIIIHIGATSDSGRLMSEVLTKVSSDIWTSSHGTTVKNTKPLNEAAEFFTLFEVGSCVVLPYLAFYLAVNEVKDSVAVSQAHKVECLVIDTNNRIARVPIGCPL
jgi:hypothetical protein